MSKGILLIVASMFLGLTGCNTIEGLGQDIQKGGEAITKSVN